MHYRDLHHNVDINVIFPYFCENLKENLRSIQNMPYEFFNLFTAVDFDVLGFSSH